MISKGCVKKPYLIVKIYLNIGLYIRKHYKEFHKDISIQSEEIKILLNVTEFPNSPAFL